MDVALAALKKMEGHACSQVNIQLKNLVKQVSRGLIQPSQKQKDIV